MGFNQQMGAERMEALNQSYDDINYYYANLQPHELAQLDRYLNRENSDLAYRAATDRALAEVSGSMAPNLVQAGALPNLRAQTAGIATQQAARVGGTAVQSQLTQQQRYAEGLRRVVSAGQAHKSLADYGRASNASMDDVVAQARNQARQMQDQAYMQTAGNVIGAGLSWAAAPQAGAFAEAQAGVSAAVQSGDQAALQMALAKRALVPSNWSALSGSAGGFAKTAWTGAQSLWARPAETNPYPVFGRPSRDRLADGIQGGLNWAGYNDLADQWGSLQASPLMHGAPTNFNSLYAQAGAGDWRI